MTVPVTNCKFDEIKRVSIVNEKSGEVVPFLVASSGIAVVSWKSANIRLSHTFVAVVVVVVVVSLCNPPGI